MNATRVQRDEADLVTLEAPQGSLPWARAMRVVLRQMWEEGTTELQRFQRYLVLMEREKGYQQLDDEFGHPFVSLRAFCIAKRPYGVGFDPTLLDALVAETRHMTIGEGQVLYGHGGDRRSEEFQDGHVHLEKKGTTTRYRIARLKRDYPDIAEALARGDYPSVRAAAKAAGFVHDPTPLDYLHRYWRQVAPEDRLRFLIEMLTPNERRALQFGFEEEDLA